MEVMREWVRNIFMFIIALSFIEMLLPSSKFKAYVKFVFSLAIIASIITPLTGLME